jgi:hypothetical protein
LDYLIGMSYLGLMKSQPTLAVFDGVVSDFLCDYLFLMLVQNSTHMRRVKQAQHEHIAWGYLSRNSMCSPRSSIDVILV